MTVYAINLYLSESNWRQEVSARFGALPSAWATGSTVYNPPSLAAGAEATTTVTVTGAILGAVALASFSLDTQGITLAANVSAADTVTVRLRNGTAGLVDLASGTLTAAVLVP